MADQVTMRFLVDETSFELPLGLGADVIRQHIEAFIGIVRARHDADEDVFRWSKLEEVQVQPGTLFWELLYQDETALSLDHELRQAFQQAINRCIFWDDQLEPAPDPAVNIDGIACVAPTVSVVHALVSEGRGAACLSLGVRADRSGVHYVEAGEIVHSVHFITAESHVRIFYRTLFEIEDLDPGSFMDNARHAFPDIAFVSGLAKQFHHFDTKYKTVRPIVTNHLSALNDHFPNLFKRHDGKPFETMAELSATCHVDASPESPKTHANRKAMKERDVAVEYVSIGRRKVPVGKTVRCEWHTKISPTTDRIHFHPGGKDSVAEGRLIVGMFVDHLPL